MIDKQEQEMIENSESQEQAGFNIEFADLKGFEAVYLYQLYVKMVVTLLPYAGAKIDKFSDFPEYIENLTEEEKTLFFAKIVIFAEKTDFMFLCSNLADKNGVRLGAMNINNFSPDQLLEACARLLLSQFEIGRGGFFLRLLKQI